MKLPLLTILIWFISVILQFVLCVVIVRARLLRTWPFLFALCALELVESIVESMLTGRQHRRAYRNIYWYSSAIGSLLNLGFIGDAVRAVPGLLFLPRNFKLMFGVAALSSVGTILWLVSYDTVPKGALPVLAWQLERWSLAWLVLMLSLLGLVCLFGMGWCRQALGIVGSMLCSSITTIWAASSMAHYPEYARTVDTIHSAVYLLILGWWIRLLAAGPELPPDVSDLTPLLHPHPRPVEKEEKA